MASQRTPGRKGSTASNASSTYSDDIADQVGEVDLNDDGEGAHAASAGKKKRRRHKKKKAAGQAHEKSD